MASGWNLYWEAWLVPLLPIQPPMSLGPALDFPRSWLLEVGAKALSSWD